MIRTITTAAVLLMLASTPGLAQKVHVDYDKTAQFSKYKTFSWHETADTKVKDPLMHSRIKNAIEHQLSQGGLTEVASNPDVFVTYHTAEKEEKQLNTTSYGYGYGGGWAWDPYWGGGMGMGMGMGGMGMASSTTNVVTYTRGTLVIDIWDAKQKQLIFRGTAEKIIPDKPSKQEKLIDKAVTKIAQKFDQMYEKDQKSM